MNSLGIPPSSPSEQIPKSKVNLGIRYRCSALRVYLLVHCYLCQVVDTCLLLDIWLVGSKKSFIVLLHHAIGFSWTLVQYC